LFKPQIAHTLTPPLKIAAYGVPIPIQEWESVNILLAKGGGLA
jgi:hypothetical protein